MAKSAVDTEYELKRERALNTIDQILNVGDKIVNIAAPIAAKIVTKQKVGFWDYAFAGVQGVIELAKDPITVSKAVVNVVVNNYYHGDDYPGEVNKLTQVLKKGQIDIDQEPFFLKLIRDPETVTFLEKNKGNERLDKLIEENVPVLLLPFIRELANNDELKNQAIALRKNDQEAKALEIENSSPYRRAEVIQELGKVGVDEAFINKNITPLITSVVKPMLDDPQKMIDTAKLFVDRAFITDAGEKDKNLSKILDNIDIPKILAETKLPSLLDSQGVTLAKAGRVILNSNDMFKNIKAKLEERNNLATQSGSLDDLLEKSISLGLKAVSATAKDTESLTAIYKSAKPFIEGNIAKEDLLTTHLKLARSIANLMAKDPTLTILKDELPQFLQDNKGTISRVIENAQTAYPDSTFTKLLKKTSPQGIQASDAEIFVDAFALVTKITLPIITDLARESLSHPDELGIIIEQGKKVIDSNKTNQTNEIKGLINMLSTFKKENANIKKIIDKDLPKLLNKHKIELGATLDVCLNQTQIGKKLNLKGSDVLEIASKKTPQLVEIAELYAKNKYAAMIPKAAKIMADKQVLKLMVESGINYMKYNPAKDIRSKVDKNVGNSRSVHNTPVMSQQKQRSKQALG